MPGPGAAALLPEETTTMTRYAHLRRFLGVAVVLSGFVVACGDDNAAGETTPGAAATVQVDAAPEEYISGVCTAAASMFGAYQKSFAENREALGGMDPTDAYARTARAPFARLIAELEQLTPPSDAVAGHAETLRQAREVLAALNEGDRQKLLSLRGTPDTGTWKQVIDLAPDLRERYGATSSQVGACRELATNGGGNPFD